MGKRAKAKKSSAKQQQQEEKQPEPKIVEDVPESDDEEINEDEAFNSEDERLYGHFFKKNRGGDDDENSDDEDDDGLKDEDSDDDDEEEDDGGQYMLDLLDKLNSGGTGNKTKESSASAQMASVPESEYSASLSKKGLTLDNLMEGLQDTQGFRDLQKTFQKQQTTTPAPLDRVVADRAQRKIAYDQQVENISAWTKAVQENRQAETLDFKPKERLVVSKDTLIDKFEPTTDFEKELEKALEEAGVQDEEAVLKAEEQALQDDLGANKLTMEEYKKRRGQLSQIRALMFYHEQKRHHIKKIKSKKYRRIRKKQREKLKDSAMEAAMEEDHELAQELKEKEEVSRIQERMTLAHKNTSKWAKRILKRGKNVDQDTRRALSAQLQRGDDLRRKMMGDNDNDSDADDSGDEDLVESARKVLQETEDDPTNGKTGLFALSFMQKGIQKQRDRAKEEARRLLNELEANERDDASIENDDNSKEDVVARKEVKIATEKEMKNVLQDGELVATSLEFGNSNAVATSGGIEIDISTTNDNAKDDEDSDSVGNESKVKSTGTSSEHVSTMVVKGTPQNEAATHLQNTASPTKKRNKAKQVATEAKNEEDEANPWMQSQKGGNDIATTSKKRKNKKGIVDVEGAIDILDAGNKELDTTRNNAGEVTTSSNDEGDKMITKLSQEELVRRAFAAPSDKEVEDDFRKEKEDMALEDDPTRKAKKAKAASQEEVAGWGSWTGAGALAPPPPRRLPKKLQAPTKKKGDPNKRKRKDDKKPDVIINQKRMKKTANGYMLGDVPHPYSSRAEYEQAMLGGVGKEWNVTSAFKNMTRPEIMTRSGKIIQPISKKAKAARPAAKF